MKTKYVVEEEKGLKQEYFGGVGVFRPKRSTELLQRIEAEEHLRKKYKTGIYKDEKTITEILKYMYDFMHSRLVSSIQEIADLSFLQFILWQYDLSFEINNKDLTEEEKRKWREFGPKFRRALKYIAELIVMIHDPIKKKNPSDLDKILKYGEEVLVNAEQLVDLYTECDATFLIFQERTTFTINPSKEPIGSDYYYDIRYENNFFEDFNRRSVLDHKNSNEFFKPRDFLYNIPKHGDFLNDSFLEKIGINYENAVSIIGLIDHVATPPTDGFDVPFINKKMAVDKLFSYTSYSKEAIENVISGFLLTKEKMLEHNRELFKPKQDYRALRRAFFEFPHETGTHIIWSRRMLHESLVHLVHNIVFRQCPAEWNKGEIKNAIETLSNASGKWFEDIVAKNIQKLGFIGKSNVNGIGKHKKHIHVPKDVGEIDFIGYSEKEKLIIIAECKLVGTTNEPKEYRNDIEKFVKEKDSYLSKFTKKRDWVKDNIEEIKKSLSDEINTTVSPTGIAHLIITGYPTTASYFIDETKCVSITEFCMAYKEKECYPYEDTIIKLIENN